MEKNMEPDKEFKDKNVVFVETLFDEEGGKIPPPPKGRIFPVLSKMSEETYSGAYVVRKPKSTIGRAPYCDIIIDDMKVSRNHAYILYENFQSPDELPRCILYDDNSRNGTLVNNERIKEPRVLKNGDRILFGGYCLWYYIRSELELRYDDNLQGILKKHGYKPIDAGVSPRLKVEIEIVFPEETFTPKRLRGILEYLSLTGIRVITYDIHQDLYKQILQTNRYAKVRIHLKEMGKEFIFHCRISWLNFDAKQQPPSCVVGLALEKQPSQEEKEIILALTKGQEPPTLGG
jgi:hypothetical protein